MSRRFVRAIEQLESRTLFSAAGDIDPGFSGDGLVTYKPLSPNTEFEFTRALDVRNNRIVVAGSTDGRVALAMFDLSGNFVRSFSGDGIETEVLPGGGAIDVALLSNNKVLVLTSTAVARFNANGTRDMTFGGGDGVTELPAAFTTANAMALSPDGIIVAGQQNTGGANNVVVVTRLSENGSLDNGFGVSGPGITTFTGGVGPFFGTDVAAMPDGRIVFVAPVNGDNPSGGAGDNYDTAVVRLAASGAFDLTFGNNDGVARLELGDEEVPGGVAIDAQGRPVVAAVDQVFGNLVVQRLTVGGFADPTFTRTSLGVDLGAVAGITIAPDGKIVVGGSSGGLVGRLNANGGADPSFGSGSGYVRGVAGDSSIGFGIDVQPDGKIVTASSGFNVSVVRRLGAANSQTPLEGTVTLANGTLTYTGSSRSEMADVRSGVRGEYVQVNNGLTTREFPAAAVQRIEMRGLGGNDRLTTSLSIPALLAGGDDIVDGGQGTDLQDGGEGADTVDYSFRNSAVYVDLEGDADDGPAGERDTVAANVEHILGGRGNDTLVGNGANNFIRGNGGNDTIRGGGGNDTLTGDAGQDKLYGEAGDDFLDARDGIIDLVLDGGADTDTAKKDNNDPQTGIELLA